MKLAVFGLTCSLAGIICSVIALSSKGETVGLSGSPEAWKRLAGAAGMSKMKWVPTNGGWMKAGKQDRYLAFFHWLTERQDIKGKPMHDETFCADASVALAEWEKNFVPLSEGRDPNTTEEP